MDFKLVLIVFIIILNKVFTQSIRKTDLSHTLRRLKNVLHKLQTKQYVIVNTNKDLKTLNVTSKNGTSNMIGIKLNKSNGNVTEENNWTEFESKRSKSCEENYSRSNRKVVCSMAIVHLDTLRDYLSPLQRLLMNPKLCTHVVLRSYAALSLSTNNIVTFNLVPDLFNKKQDIIDLQSKGIQVLVGIHTWEAERLCKNLAVVYSDSNLTLKFVEDTVSKLKSFGLDGLDLEWYHPACCTAPCTRKSQQLFLNFMKVFYENTQRSKLLLSLSLHPFDQHFLRMFDFPEQANYVDFLMLRMFDGNGPLTGHSSSASAAFTALNNLLKLKVDPKKIIFGYTSTASTFNLKDKNKNKIRDASTGPGRPGNILKCPGKLAFFEYGGYATDIAMCFSSEEICAVATQSFSKLMSAWRSTVCDELKRKDWTIMRSPKITNYAFRDTLWVSYDDPNSIRYKVQVTKDLGGVGAWEIELDDYANLCGCGYFPLLRAANFPDCEVADCV